MLDSSFMPHGHCYQWQPEIVWLHAVSDSTIAASYYSIPFFLVYFAHRRQDLAFKWMFVLFGAFILLCGTTHVLDVWSIWHGTYRLTGIVKMATGAVSLATAILLIPLVPKALALPSIDDFRRAETSLRAARDREAEQSRLLRQRNDELQEFAHVASHDLQEPLRKIRAFGEMLTEEYSSSLDDTATDYLDRIQNAAERMSELIDDLLAFSRVSTQVSEFSVVSLEDTVRGVLSDLELAIVESEGHIDVGELPEIEADGLQMRQLFQNLIGNAVKFRKPGVPPRVIVRGQIEHSSALADSGADRVCRITVSDNGIGFDNQYSDRIFAPFKRLHGRDTYYGTGIGLAICRRIVDRHGGIITAESESGEGSTFTVLLPAARRAVSSVGHNASVD